MRGELEEVIRCAIVTCILLSKPTHKDEGRDSPRILLVVVNPLPYTVSINAGMH